MRPSSSTIDPALFNELVGHIYDTALDFTRWPAVVERICRALDSRSGLLRAQDLRTNEVGAYVTHGLDPLFRRKYEEHYIHLDTLVPTVAEQPVGTIHIAATIMPESFFKGEFYNDYALPQGQAHSAGCVLTRNGSQLTVLGLHRPGPNNDYRPHELVLIERLTPHLQRALRIDRYLWQLRNETDASQDTLQRLTTGVILVDAAGKPLFLNRQAEEIIAAGTVLGVSGNSLRASTWKDTRALHKLIFEASRGTPKSGGAIAISSPGAVQSLSILVTPVGKEPGTGFQLDNANVAAALLIRPTGEQLGFSLEALSLLHGLTRAEARLAAALANGRSLDEIATRFNLSLNTVRTQLKSCFRRTGVNRQTELVKLVICTPTVWSDEPGDG